MFNFILCDDNPSFINTLDNILNRLFIKHNLDAEIKFKTDNTDQLLDYITNNYVDVLFLDISLKNKINGLKIAEKIRKINKNLIIIFTTAHFEYVMEAYKVHTFDYLVKPISQEKLEETLLRVIEYLKHPENNFLKINNTTFVNQNDIQYIQKDGMKVIYHTHENNYTSYSSFLKLQNELPNSFVRCHKSYIVNTSNINHVESSTNTIFFNNQDKCFIGPKYKSNFMEVINYDLHPINFNSINYT